MSLITRCPACETMFKVVPDQLRISNGWVRCGQCAEIFDAAQHLLAGASGATAPPPAGNAGAAARHSKMPDAPAPSVTHHSVPSAAVDATPVPLGTGPTPDARPEEVSSPAAAPSAQLSAAAPRDALTTEGPEPQAAPRSDTEAGPQPPPAFLDQPQDPAPEPAPGAQEAPEVSFLRRDRSPSVWRRPLVRVALLLLLLLLLAALALQILRQERDRVAQVEPATRPLLLALCAWSACTVSPLRQIEAIVIDSSSFGRIRGDLYRLGFSLRNQAPVDVAMPAIELALTDTQDQPLVRRVILPAEFGAPSQLLAAGADWSGSLSLSVKVAENAQRISGYRVLAFYP